MATPARSNLTRLFLKSSRETLVEQYWPRLRGCVESLSDEQVWWRPNEASNSIGNLLLHLNGNVRQWLLSSFDGAEDHRNRPAEFSERRVLPAAHLLEQLGATIAEVSKLLARLGDSELLEEYEIQGYRVTGIEAVYHVVEHFGMHYGQILFVTKLVRGENLGFYAQLDKTGRLP